MYIPARLWPVIVRVVVRERKATGVVRHGVRVVVCPGATA
jgi:hypothetical protein